MYKLLCLIFIVMPYILNAQVEIKSDTDQPLLYISSNGDVGIGTTTPGFKLHVVDGKAQFDNSASTLQIDGSSIIGIANPLHIRSSDGQSAVVLAENDGYVGIGTTSPTSKLDINAPNGYNQLRLRASYTPTGTGDSNGETGDVAWDDQYIYVKTNQGWKRTAIGSF